MTLAKKIVNSIIADLKGRALLNKAVRRDLRTIWVDVVERHLRDETGTTERPFADWEKIMRELREDGAHQDSKRPKLKFKETNIGLRVKDDHKTKIVLPFDLWDALATEECPDGRYSLGSVGRYAVKIGIAEVAWEYITHTAYRLTELGQCVKAQMPPPPVMFRA